MNIILLGITIVLCITIFYINYTVYAGLMNMGFFGSWLGLSLVLGVQTLLKRNNRQRRSLVNGGLILLIVILFVVAMPDYSYEEAQDIAANAYLEQSTTDAITIHHLKHQTIPSTNNSSWLLKNRIYYVGIGSEDEAEATYYVVDPIQGKSIELEQPYWRETQ